MPAALPPERGSGGTMFLALFFILLMAWVIAWAALHLASGFIHLLLIFAVISMIVHFVRGRRAV
jgi:Flp pilus assembly protein TadB